MTNKIRRGLLAGLVLATIAVNGCILTSAQILVNFELGNVDINNVTAAVGRVVVDLNSISDYSDNKDKLKNISDFAVLGKFVNNAGPAGSVEVWVTPEVTNFTTVNAIQSGGGVRLWGPGSIGAAGTPGGTVTLGWDESAALFSQAGKNIVLGEAKGDGAFTLYAAGTAGVYDISVQNGVLVLVLEAGI
ncbi:MAG: hypothetical protein HOP12_09960 [Candidatus Eisenbacteria bacterium]|uniref:Uncharacterized protein n=1 Tax=Eiseniibacteriota bacterium TaxID=2212470 RepID=A0A849SJ65_UNCEI|nr:hypothetical protein [Candidatus Eisenbacteria bacterium]